MMKKKTISCSGQKKNLKPIDYDLHLKYLCPNSDCNAVHWVSLSEASVKNFKVVCYCGYIFSPKPIDKIKIKYKNSSKPLKITEPIEKKDEAKFIDKAIDLLKSYGFDANEAQSLINESIKQNPNITDYVTLVKHSLFLVKND